MSQPTAKNSTTVQAKSTVKASSEKRMKPQASIETKAVGAGNVDQIRDILFGNQMRDYERKFNRLEERIMKEVSRLREESSKRFDNLETHIRTELDTLSERQKSETKDRTQTLKEMTAEFQKSLKMLDNSLVSLDGELSSSSRDLRQQILDQSNDLYDEIRRKYDESSADQERIAGELREEKIDRSALSALFTDLALHVSGESLMSDGREEEHLEGISDRSS